MDLSNFREEYLKGQLHRKDLAENPFEQFQTWFEQALKADIPEPNAFSLATADAQGRPSLRTVLLKYFDRTGFVFFTNYGSHKARDIEEIRQVCMDASLGHAGTPDHHLRKSQLKFPARNP